MVWKQHAVRHLAMLLCMYDSCLTICYDGCHTVALIPAHNHAVHAVTTAQHANHAGQICYIMFQIATACCNFTTCCLIDREIMLCRGNFSTSWSQSDVGTAYAVHDVMMLCFATACSNSDSMFTWMNMLSGCWHDGKSTRHFSPCASVH
jgi:hypothetical protein